MTSLLQPEQLLDDPRPSPSLSSPSLFFSGPDNATPVPEPLTDPETGAPIVSQLADPGLHVSGSDSGWSDGAPSDRPDDPTSSDTSPAGRPSPLSKRAAKETARAAVLTAGAMAHRALATTEGKLAAGVYLTDEEDAQKIGDPLGSLAHRHAGALGEKVSDDTADLMQAMFGVANYFGKQINALHHARRIDLGQTTGHQPQHEYSDGPEGF